MRLVNQTRRHPVLWTVCLATLAVASWTSTAQAEPVPKSILHLAKPVGIGATASKGARLTVHGTHGYRVTIRTVERGLALIASRGQSLAIYQTDNGQFDGNAIRGKFGPLGEVAVAFRPSGRVKSKMATAPAGCSPERQRVFERLGVFVGIIRFRGEHDFTRVNVRHARGRVEPAIRVVCRSNTKYVDRCTEATDCRGPDSVGTPEKWGHPQKPTLESYSWPTPPSTRFYAGQGALEEASVWSDAGYRLGIERLKRGRVPFFAVSSELRKQALSIARIAAVSGAAGTFTFNDRLTNATVNPPLPFSGEATLNLCDERTPRRLRGNLAVTLPGREISLARDGFLKSIAVLRPRGSCASQYGG